MEREELSIEERQRNFLRRGEGVLSCTKMNLLSSPEMLVSPKAPVPIKVYDPKSMQLHPSAQKDFK